MKKYIILFLVIVGCGSPKVEDQKVGTLTVPEFPVSREDQLGLQEALGDQDKTYSGQMLVWNQSASPDIVAEVVTTLTSTDQPLVDKYQFMNQSIMPLIKEFGELTSLKNIILKKADPRIGLFDSRMGLAKAWFAGNLSKSDVLDDPATEEDELAKFTEKSRARFATYCEAKIWQRTFQKPYVYYKYSRRPTPLAVCEKFYAENDLLSEKTPLCSPSDKGKDYTECLWFEGVLKTNVFKNLWYGNNKNLEKKLTKKEVFDQLSKVAKDKDSIVDISNLLLNGDAVYAANGDVLIPALENSDGFSDFNYKKCRRYRAGCTPTIEVAAPKLRNVIDFSETDHQILFFTTDSRGSNGIGDFASLDFEGESANESIFNDAFVIGVQDTDDDLQALDQLAIRTFGDTFPKTVFNQEAQKELNKINSIIEKKIASFRGVGALLEKDRESACAIEGNFYCPIQDATNASLQLAVRSDVSRGLFRSVTLKASQLPGSSSAYLLNFGFREDNLHSFCVGVGSAVQEKEQCQDNLFDVASYDIETGQVTLVIESLTMEHLDKLGFNLENSRPAKVDLFDKNSEVTKIDFFEYDLNLLVGKRLSVEMTPFSVAGMFEKMSGTLKISGSEGETVVLGNLSLRETEATNPWDLMWTEFKTNYL